MHPTPKNIVAAYEAAKSTPGIKRYKLGAVLYDRKNTPLQARGNLRKTHPKLLRFSMFPCLHAESYCILSQGLDHCSGLSLFVCRLNASNDFVMAKPCDACLKLAGHVGISNIFFTDWNGKVVQL